VEVILFSVADWDYDMIKPFFRNRLISWERVRDFLPGHRNG